jgi:hypothetical protein
MKQDSKSPSPLGRLRAAVYQERPGVFNGFRKTLGELQSIARTYGALQKYEVTQSALNAITNLLAEYLRIRDGDLLMPSSIHAIFGPVDLEFDTVLTEAMEGMSAIFRTAVRSGDLQLSLQLINAFESLALQSVATAPLFSPPDENPTTTFIRAYMSQPILEGATKGLDDLTMAGSRAHANIAQALLKVGHYLSVRTTVDEIEKLSYFAIAQRKAHVTATPVKGIADVLQLAIVESIPAGRVIPAALDALQRICVMELGFKTPVFDESLRFAVGAILDITQPTALSNLGALAIDRLIEATKAADTAKLNDCREVIRELNDRLWNRLADIGTAAAKTQSFALFYINSNIAQISNHCFSLLAFLNETKPEGITPASAHEAWLHEKFKDEVLGELNWIVGATYWRIFDALEAPININSIWDFFPTLSHIGIQALEFILPSVAEAAISELESISIKAIEVQVQGLHTAASIASFIARIGIVAEMKGEQRIVSYSIVALNNFQKRYFAKQRELQPDAESYDATLLNELADLKRELGRDRWLIDEEDASFFGKVSPEDIDRYIIRLEARPNPASDQH